MTVFQGIYGTGDPRTIGLDRLIERLTRLKSFQFQKASADLWEDESVPASHGTPRHIPSAHEVHFSDLLRSLEESKSCLAALDEVRDHLKRRICRLRKACAPFVLSNGVNTLPDEIISEIFEAGHRMTEGWTFAKSVSHVSRRFRQLSLQTPLLWTRLEMHCIGAEGQLQAFLSRSGQLDLEVGLSDSMEDKILVPYLHILRSTVHRWSHLRIGSQTAKELIEEAGLTNFPHLQYLYDDSYNFNLSKETVPLLSGYSKRIYTPSDYTFLAQLTSLELVHEDTDVDIMPLARSLYSLKNLKKLSLKLDKCFEVNDPEKITDVLGLHSVLIDSLRLAILNWTSPWVTLSLYQGLRFLSPSTVDIYMEDLLHDNEGHTLEDYFVNLRGNFPYGSTITIHAARIKEQTFRVEPSPILTYVVERCPIARTIHFEGQIVSFIRLQSTNWRQFSSLRHLRFKSCDYLTELEVEELARNLMCGKPEGTGLQSLEIFSCPKISEEFLVVLGDEVGPKLKWKICDCD